MYKGNLIYSADGREAGHTTGGEYPCRMESCKGRRIGVKWPDGKITFPCSEGIDWSSDEWQIKGE